MVLSDQALNTPHRSDSGKFWTGRVSSECPTCQTAPPLPPAGVAFAKRAPAKSATFAIHVAGIKAVRVLWQDNLVS